MDRTGQLRNVSFGGAWSEQIAGREELQTAIARLRAAAEAAADEDPRCDAAVSAALDLASRAHPKGALLRIAWARGAALSHPGLRVHELKRLVDLFDQAYGGWIR